MLRLSNFIPTRMSGLFHRSKPKIYGFFFLVLLAFYLVFEQLHSLSNESENLPISSQIDYKKLDSTWIAKHDRILKSYKLEKPKVIFLGDHIFENWIYESPSTWNKYFKNYVNFAISNEKLDDLSRRIKNSDLEHGCIKLIVLNVGYSHLKESSSKIVSGISNVIKTIRKSVPKAKILLLSLIESGSIEEKNKIKEVNIKLSTLLPYEKAVKWLDISDHLSPVPVPNKYTKDGKKLTDVAYEYLALRLKPHIDLNTQLNFSSSNEIAQKIKKTHRTHKDRIRKTFQLDESAFLSLPHPVERAFCINLDNREDRWEHAKRQFVKVGLKVERFSAISKSDLIFDNIELSVRAQNFFIERQTHEDLPSLGALGCYLSHISVWQYMVENNITAAMIFEDDVVFPTNFQVVFAEYAPLFSQSSGFLLQ